VTEGARPLASWGLRIGDVLGDRAMVSSVRSTSNRDSKTMTVSLKDIQGTVVFRQAIAAKGR
jgi:hypothetical protein